MLATFLIIIGSYIFLCLCFYFFQHLAFFRPEILPSDFRYSYSFPFEELVLETEDGGVINAIYFTVPSSRGVVYYLKGNSRSIKGWGKFAKDFLSNGYDFVMFDYRGFGKSRGKRNQNKLYADAQLMYNWILERYDEDEIIVYGRSLGSGIAAKVAATNKPSKLILDSPYYSFYHNTRRFLFWMPLRLILRYDIRTDKFLEEVKCPVFIIHGSSDKLFPISQSKRLSEANADKVELIPIEGGGHNNLPNYPEFFESLYDILDNNPVLQK